MEYVRNKLALHIAIAARLMIQGGVNSVNTDNSNFEGASINLRVVLL